MDPEKNRMRDIIGPEKTAIMSRIYSGNKFSVPVARDALNEARRGPILAAIRAGTLTISEAVPILRLKRATISQLLNHTDEGLEDRAWAQLPDRKVDPRQLDMFGS